MASLEDIFEIKENIILIGNSSSPIFSSYNSYITDDRIYIPDYLGHIVKIYGKNGKLIAILGGKKGHEISEFEMPYGVVVDKNGYLYINDRGNNRIQVYDPSFKFYKQFKTEGPVETIMLSKESTIVIVSLCPTFPCNKRFRCLMREFDKEGNIIRSFGSFNKDYIIYSWAVANDDKDQIYICNVFEKEVHVYKSNRKFWKKIKLSSPSIVPLKTKVDPNPKNIKELMANRRAFSQESHTLIARLYAKDDYLFVLYRLKGGKVQKPVFFLDIFDIRGKLLYYGIKTPGELFCVTDKLYFVEHNNEIKYGSLRITGLKWKQKALWSKE